MTIPPSPLKDQYISGVAGVAALQAVSECPLRPHPVYFKFPIFCKLLLFIVGESYLAEQFHQITHYLVEQFRQIIHYLAEQFRQATHYLTEQFHQIAHYLTELCDLDNFW